MNKLLLHHRCVLERDQQTDDDNWGQTAAPDWQPGPCVLAVYAWIDRAGRIKADNKITVHTEQLRMILDLDADITLQDRVIRIEDSANNPLFEGPFSIETIDRRDGHFEVDLSDRGHVRV